jgi:hypothetical protein
MFQALIFSPRMGECAFMEIWYFYDPLHWREHGQTFIASRRITNGIDFPEITNHGIAPLKGLRL